MKSVSLFDTQEDASIFDEKSTTRLPTDGDLPKPALSTHHKPAQM